VQRVHAFFQRYLSTGASGVSPEATEGGAGQVS